METFPLRNEAGEIFAFEIPSSYFSSSGAVGRFFARCPGVVIERVRRFFEFGNEVHVIFSLDGEKYEVWEPFGDNSRYWVGPKGESKQPLNSLHGLESYVRANWPGPLSAARGKLFSLFRQKNVT